MSDFSENTLLDVLRRHALTPSIIASIVGAIRIRNKEKQPNTSKNDWDALKKPLRLQIHALQSNLKARKKDPIKWAVYEKYLAVLLKVRDRIEFVQHANGDVKTIPELAAEHGIGQQGLRWGAWVPERVKDAMMAEFDALHKMPKYATGKRIIPFVTQAERTLDDIRWSKIRAGLVAERTLSNKKTDEGDIVEALNHALARVKDRQLNDRAPQSWKIMLPQAIRDRIAALHAGGERV
jgi:hypothetical protein